MGTNHRNEGTASSEPSDQLIKKIIRFLAQRSLLSEAVNNLWQERVWSCYQASSLGKKQAVWKPDLRRGIRETPRRRNSELKESSAVCQGKWCRAMGNLSYECSKFGFFVVKSPKGHRCRVRGKERGVVCDTEGAERSKTAAERTPWRAEWEQENSEKGERES